MAHAAGILNALASRSIQVRVIAEEPHEILELNGIVKDIVPLKSHIQVMRQIWAIRLLSRLRSAVQKGNYGGCYMRYSASFAPWIPAAKRILGNTPLVLEVNSLGSQWRSFLRPVDRMALRCPERVVCISSSLRDYIQNLLAHREHGDIRVVLNGVYPERFNVSPVMPETSQYMNVGYAGVLKADYGLETLIQAGQRVQNQGIHIHIYGEGPYRRQLESEARGIENITFHGAVPFTQMPGYLLGMDVLVYTTSKKYLYQSPIKLFEYLAAARPILTACTPQTRELLEGRECALFFNVGDSSELADRLINLYKNPPLRQYMGQAGRELAVREHSWDARLKEIFDL